MAQGLVSHPFFIKADSGQISHALASRIWHRIPLIDFESISQPSPRQNESESQVLEDWSSAFFLYCSKWFVGTLKFDDQYYGLSVCPAQFHVVAIPLSVMVLGRGCLGGISLDGVLGWSSYPSTKGSSQTRD